MGQLLNFVQIFFNSDIKAAKIPCLFNYFFFFKTYITQKYQMQNLEFCMWLDLSEGDILAILEIRNVKEEKISI